MFIDNGSTSYSDHLEQYIMNNTYSDLGFHFVCLSHAASEVTPIVSAGPAVISIERPRVG